MRGDWLVVIKINLRYEHDVACSWVNECRYLPCIKSLEILANTCSCSFCIDIIVIDNDSWVSKGIWDYSGQYEVLDAVLVWGDSVCSGPLPEITFFSSPRPIAIGSRVSRSLQFGFVHAFTIFAISAILDDPEVGLLRIPWLSIILWAMRVEKMSAMEVINFRVLRWYYIWESNKQLY